MDRTSILGDTIDYMKELLERINKLQEEETEESKNQLNLMAISKELKPNEVLVRNSPKVIFLSCTFITTPLSYIYYSVTELNFMPP